MPLSRFLTDTATVWTRIPADPSDPFADDTWAREIISVAIKTGGETQTDSDGAEFQPQTTYWAEVELKRGQRIKPGDVSDLIPPADSEVIRKPGTWTPHPRQSREFVGFTG